VDEPAVTCIMVRPTSDQVKRTDGTSIRLVLTGTIMGSRSLPDISAVRKSKEGDQIPYFDQRCIQELSHIAKGARRAAGMGRTGH